MSGSASIAGIAYAFPSEWRTVRELDDAGLLQSDPRLLEGFGFSQVHVATHESPYSLALVAARKLMAERDMDPGSIGAIIYTGAPGMSAFAAGDSAPPAHQFLRTTERFRYPATRLQYDLGLDGASVIALDQLACTGLFGAVRLARALCIAEGMDRVLCVSAEFFPADAGREAIYNCTSDAACAVLVERGGERNRIVGAAHVTKGYYWDADEKRDEVVASYFPTARHVIDRTVVAAGWSGVEPDWVIPHNVSMRSWEILLGLAGFRGARIWSRNIARDGHTLAGDNFINLRDALDSGAVREGERVLLFSYGYGAHWTGLALEA